mgnify:CR=1 FL=1
MKEKIYDARTGMEYVLVGDYYLPALKLPRTRPIGRWGMLHKAYLKLRKPAYYQSLLLSGKLDTVLANVEEQAVERYEVLIEQLSRRYRNLGEFGTLHLVHRTEHVALALYRVTDHHQLLYLVGSHIQRDINDGTSSDRHRTGFVPQIGEFERTILGHIVQFIRTVHVGRNPVRGSRHDDTHPYERFAGLGIGHDTLDRSGLLRRNGYQRNCQDKTKKKQ